MIRLGMIGTGRIARRFVDAVKRVGETRLVCVYNPHEDSAEHFAQSVWMKDVNRPLATDSWEQLMELVDAVYIASPHATHYEYIKKALLAKKHVLCEKPMALCEQNVIEVYDLAEKQDCVLLEAIKTAYCPGFIAMMEKAKSGVIGEICDVEACFTKLVPTNMREYTDVAYGGSFTELGSYVLLPIMKLLGTNYQKVSFQSLYGMDGVDKFTKINLTYQKGIGLGKTGIGVKSEGELIISGTKGYIYCQAPWWLTKRFEVRYEDPRKQDVYEYECEKKDLQYEIEYFVQKILGESVNIQAGVTLTESAMAADIIDKFLRETGRETGYQRRNNSKIIENQGLNGRRIRIAIWGITDRIWNSIRNTLDPRKMEIKLFIDNNPQQEGHLYGDSPVCCFSEELIVQLQQMDYVLIAAYSGYSEIRKLLLSYSFPEEKIQLYITNNIILHDFGQLMCDELLINKIYFEPKRMIQNVNFYYRVHNKYKSMRNLPSNTQRWYQKSSLIAHACGGYVNEKKIMYTNSAEALNYSLKSGFLLIECDILRDSNGKIILAHDYEKLFNAICQNYTIQTLEQMIKTISHYPEVNMLIDVNWDDEQDYMNYVHEICDALTRVTASENEYHQLKKQIVMEAYNEATIQLAEENGFDVFFTQYRNPEISNYMETALLCGKYHVGAVGFSCEYILSHKSLIQIFNQKNIKIFAFSTDDLQKYKNLKEMGVHGIFTNYLLMRDN